MTLYYYGKVFCLNRKTLLSNNTKLVLKHLNVNYVGYAQPIDRYQKVFVSVVVFTILNMYVLTTYKYKPPLWRNLHSLYSFPFFTVCVYHDIFDVMKLYVK